MKLRLLTVVPLLVACGGSRFEGHEIEDTGISTQNDTDVLVNETDIADIETGVETDVAETGETRVTDTDDFEGGDLPGHELTEVEETDVEPELVDALLDDFEDGDERVHDVDGRAAAGRWTFRATTLTESGYVDLLTGQSPVEAYSLGFAGHLLAEDLLGADAEAWIAASVSHSGRGYTSAADFEGIQFSACGVGAIRFGVDTLARSAAVSGYGVEISYESSVELTDTWQVVEIAWEQLEETWEGAEAAQERLRKDWHPRIDEQGGTFDASQFNGVTFYIDYPWESGGELWLDDVAFLGGGVAGIEGVSCP